MQEKLSDQENKEIVLDERMKNIEENLKKIKHKIVIISGKG